MKKLTDEIFNEFVVIDSGERQTYSSGSLRDTTAGKVNYAKAIEGPMFKRWAAHLTKAEAKYPNVAPGISNWSLINTEEELVRYKESAFRHFIQWYAGETDEDHASAVFFGINGVEYIRARRQIQEAK